MHFFTPKNATNHQSKIHYLAWLLCCFFCYWWAAAQHSQTHVVDFKTAEANVKLIPNQKKVKGEIQYSFEIIGKTDSVFLDAQKMKASLLKASFRNAKLITTNQHLIFKGKFKENKTYSFSVSFEALPQQSLYFLGFDFEKELHQIWTQGQGKYTSHWLPSIDDMNDKIIFNLSIEAPSYLTLIANGKQTKVEAKDSSRIWQFSMQKPMSSYLVAFAAGNFDFIEEKSASGIPLYNYIETKDSLLHETTYRHTQFIFDFFEKEIGVPYPWQNYKQVPVRDFLYSGMENTSLTLFSNQFVVDSIGFKDINYVMVNAHEMAHQWFGNLVTETEATHHWLHEGFATYYALLAEREIFGEDYFYYQLYTSAEQLKEMSDKGKGEAILNPKASSLTFYQKGAWALHILREKVGEEAFKKAVKSYLEKYAFKNADTDQFLEEITLASGLNTAAFKKDWLRQTAFQAEDAVASLKKSLFIQELLSIISLREQKIEDKTGIFQKKLNSKPNEYITEEIALQLAEHLENKQAEILIKQILSMPNQLRAQKQLTKEIAPIPEAYQTDFENLFQEKKSYLLTENLLYNLWVSFPENRAIYLDFTKDMDGFKQLNIALLWRFLSMVTPDHEPKKAITYFNELNAFTSPRYSFQIRENSFNYLYQVDRFTDEAYLNLIDACFHQPWRFKRFARRMLEELLEDEQHQIRILDLERYLSKEKLKLIRQYLSE